jgi:GH25 family lysozyme M1 (1,4-beta-N-acetylmuramidase)
MKGIDISAYQENVDFAKVKAAGIEVVYIKATEGTGYINPLLKTQYSGAKAAGLKVGFYHFFRAKNEANAIQQAQYFVNAVSGLEYDCRLALDIETSEGIAKAALSTIAKAFLDQVKALTGLTPVLYTYSSFISESLNNTLAAYPLWIANYSNTAPGSNSIWSTWIGWQYSEKGSVSGITGNVDLDTFTEDIFTEEEILLALISQDSAGNLVKDGTPATWATQAVATALNEGFITQTHNANELVTMGAMLAIFQNILEKKGLV